MNFKLIKNDNMIIIDGKELKCDFDIDENIHAIQYCNGICEVEYVDKPSEIVDFTQFQYLVDLYNQTKSDKIQKQIDLEKSINESMTYLQKRKEEYPPIEDYIDGIVKGDEAQVQAYVDACLAVKAKYPKSEEVQLQR